jgi:hypothetical protein
MLSNGSNAPTWSVLAGFVITPPPGGFQQSFTLGFYSEMLPPPIDGTGVPIIEVVGITAEFDVVESPSFPVTSFIQDPQTGLMTISWFGVMGLSYHVQWKSDLSDVYWTTITNGLIGANATLNWTDDGTQTAPLSEPVRFYQISIP